jgi:type VI secretion system ImpB/VipA family protein
MEEQEDKIGKIDVSMGEQGAVTKTEMPLRMLVLGDFTPEAPDVENWEESSRLINVTLSSFGSVMQQLSPRLSMDVTNRLNDSPKELTVELNFPDMKSFRPEGIAQQVPELANLLGIRRLVSQVKDRKMSLEEFDQQAQQMGIDSAWLERFHQMLSASQTPATPEPSPPSEGETKPEGGGLDALLNMVDVPDEQAPPEQTSPVDGLLRAISGAKKGGAKADKSVVEAIIDELDQSLSQQIDEILHHSKFQQLESAWRGLKLLIDRADFQGNIKIEMLSVRKDQLRDAVYHQVFTPEYNELTETPLSVMVADFDFGRTPEEIELLGDMARIAASIQVPFIASVGPAFFGSETAEGLTRLPMLRSFFQEPAYAEWNALRDDPDSQYVVLTMPRFLLRLPYGPDGIQVKEFNSRESAKSADDHLWGRGTFAVATTIVRSFIEDGWPIRVTGLRGGGMVENLPVCVFRWMSRSLRARKMSSWTTGSRCFPVASTMTRPASCLRRRSTVLRNIRRRRRQKRPECTRPCRISCMPRAWRIISGGSRRKFRQA